MPDANGSLPLNVTRANAIARHAIAIADAVSSHGGKWIFENPVGREAGSQFAIEGREDHASLWKLPEMAAFAARHGNHTVCFDQCRTGASTQKTTQLLCSANIVGAVRDRLGHLVCNHPSGTHQPIVGGNVTDGFQTKSAENFTSELNRLLAESFLAPVKNHAGDAWLYAVGTAIEPFTNARVLQLSYAATLAHVAYVTDMDDPISLLRGIRSMYNELDDVDQAAACDIMHVCADMALQLNVTDVFKVSMANQNSSDHPSYRQAMKGAEAAEWTEACDKEMANLERYNIYVPVPEDMSRTCHGRVRGHDPSPPRARHP